MTPFRSGLELFKMTPAISIHVSNFILSYNKPLSPINPKPIKKDAKQYSNAPKKYSQIGKFKFCIQERYVNKSWKQQSHPAVSTQQKLGTNALHLAPSVFGISRVRKLGQFYADRVLWSIYLLGEIFFVRERLSKVGYR